MDAGRFDRLTPTQRNVLRLAADHSNDEIARALGLSRETVKTHLAHAKLRLDGMHRGAASRALREIEAGTPSLAVPPSRVNPEQGIGGKALDAASLLPTPGTIVTDTPDVTAVRETRATFEPFPPAVPAPVVRTRFHALTALDRLRLVASATLKVAIAILVMLAVAEALERMIASNPGVIPHR